MHRTPIQQHFHNLKTAGLSTYQAEAVVRSAFADDQKDSSGNFRYSDTASVLLYGCTWADMPGNPGQRMVYPLAHDRLTGCVGERA